MSDDERFIRRAIAMAWEARERGNEPFGAALVENGEVIAEFGSRNIELNDPTAHAELGLISAYCRSVGRFSLAGCTLYCSTEPCPMCAGAIRWARVSRVVYSVSQPMKEQISGGSPKMRCDVIINSGSNRAEIVGPILADEGRAVFEGYTFGRQQASEEK